MTERLSQLERRWYPSLHHWPLTPELFTDYWDAWGKDTPAGSGL